MTEKKTNQLSDDLLENVTGGAAVASSTLEKAEKQAGSGDGAPGTGSLPSSLASSLAGASMSSLANSVMSTNVASSRN